MRLMWAIRYGRPIWFSMLILEKINILNCWADASGEPQTPAVSHKSRWKGFQGVECCQRHCHQRDWESVAPTCVNAQLSLCTKRKRFANCHYRRHHKSWPFQTGCAECHQKRASKSSHGFSGTEVGIEQWQSARWQWLASKSHQKSLWWLRIAFPVTSESYPIIHYLSIRFLHLGGFDAHSSSLVNFRWRSCACPCQQSLGFLPYVHPCPCQQSLGLLLLIYVPGSFNLIEAICIHHMCSELVKDIICRGARAESFSLLSG